MKLPPHLSFLSALAAIALFSAILGLAPASAQRATYYQWTVEIQVGAHVAQFVLPILEADDAETSARLPVPSAAVACAFNNRGNGEILVSCSTRNQRTKLQVIHVCRPGSPEAPTGGGMLELPNGQRWRVEATCQTVGRPERSRRSLASMLDGDEALRSDAVPHVVGVDIIDPWESPVIGPPEE